MGARGQNRLHDSFMSFGHNQAMKIQPPGSSGKTVGYNPNGGIVWFGTLKAGLAEAKRTNRPILLMSAVPECHGVSGIW